MDFFEKWGEAAYTSLGFFWMAMWAFILGYFISAMIQIFVTEERMKKIMGNQGAKSVLLGTFFGFISSSCSFSALATSKTLFKKGASFVSSVAFLLASTNLVIELGIIISIFLGWQFVVAEYLGGIMLILISWVIVILLNPKKMISKARQRLGEPDDHMHVSSNHWKKRLSSKKNWSRVGRKYAMEWKMVWKDVTIGFTIAGVVAAFVPNSFFQTLFINTGDGKQVYDFWTLLEHVIMGPLAAFFTFIGSMGNIPLAALLFGKGVSFAGVMAFIFSDLVVFPVLRINAKYYGWKMSFFILFLLLTSLVAASLILHYGFDLFDLLPNPNQTSLAGGDYFEVNYTLLLNLGFLLLTAWLIYLGFYTSNEDRHHKSMAHKSAWLEKILKTLAIISYIWLILGIVFKFTQPFDFF